MPQLKVSHTLSKLFFAILFFLTTVSCMSVGGSEYGKDVEFGQIVSHNDLHYKFKFKVNLDVNDHNITYELLKNGESVYSAFSVFLITLLGACFSGLGVVIFLFIDSPSSTKSLDTTYHNQVHGICSSVAAGMMLGACIALFVEGFALVQDFSPESNFFIAFAFKNWQFLLGSFVGVAGMKYLKYFLTPAKSRECEEEESHILDLQNSETWCRALMVFYVMFVHAFAEGASLGLAFSSQKSSVINSVVSSMALHNIPEGLAVILVMMNRGSTIKQAALWSIVSSLPQPLMAVPAFLFGHFFDSYINLGLGFAAGAMALVVFTELIPEAAEHLKNWKIFFIVLATSFSLLWFCESGVVY